MFNAHMANKARCMRELWGTAWYRRARHRGAHLVLAGLLLPDKAARDAAAAEDGSRDEATNDDPSRVPTPINPIAPIIGAACARA